MSDDPSSLPPGCEILVLEDDSLLRRQLAGHLRSLGATVTEASRLAEVRRLAATMRFDFALVDLHLPDGEVLELLRERVFSENTGIVVMTAFGGVKQAVEAMRLGASDYLAKPFEREEVPLAFLRCRSVRGAVRREESRGEQDAIEADRLYFGDSLLRVRTELDTILAAERRLEHGLPPILIEGETGTGKTALARWLHRSGPRAQRPFVTVNCAALPDTLAEAELFGHERGAFTDAKQARLGLWEAAEGGTLFLDEVASLAPITQGKVLLAVEDGTIRRLGGTREIATDVRLITASNQSLAELVQKGEFREDLYQRLDLLHVHLPPLRERGGDMIPIAGHLLSRIGARHRLRNLELTPGAEQRILAQRWRGNIRELAHELERAVIFEAGPRLELAHLSEASTAPAAAWRNPAWRIPEQGFSLDEVVAALIAEAMVATRNNVSAAARRLGVTRDFLRYRLEQDAATGGPKD